LGSERRNPVGWWRCKSWNGEWLCAAPSKSCEAPDGVWCKRESKSWRLRRELMEKKRAGALGGTPAEPDVEMGSD
jgi:hypothetical protein